MPLTPDELEHMANEGEGQTEVRIRHTVHCGTCGYNLKSLPIAYTCPECGNPYSARPLKMHGVYQPGNEAFPGARLASVILCGLIGAILFGAGVATKEPLRLIMGGFFLVVTAILVVASIADLRAYWRARSIQIRINEEKKQEQHF